MTEAEAETVTNNFCKVPPERARVEYHIWLNEKKLNYYGESPFYKGDKHHQHLDGFKKLIACGKKLLKELDENEQKKQ